MLRPAVQFYHLLTTPLERALPALMEKALASGIRAVVQGTQPQVGRLDAALWNYDPDAFLPHGTQADPRHERQPVYLTTAAENPNGAALLVVTDGRCYEGGEGFTRVFDVFDGGDAEAVAAARRRWKSYGDAGFPLTYVKQKDDGGWEKLAEA